MTAIYRTVFAALLIFVISVNAEAQNNVPVYMWNIDTDAVTNPLHTLNSGELVEKLASSLADRQLIAIFMQDELSVEDFKSEDLSALKSVAESDNDGTFYHPSVSNPENLPKTLQEKGYNVIEVKSHQDLPTTSINERTVLVIHLPVTLAGDLRSENLQLNGDAIANVYEVMKSQQPNVVGVFTALKNSKIPTTATRKVKRAAPNGITNQDIFVNSGDVFLFMEKPPVLKLRNDKTWANFTLDQVPEYTKSGESSLVLIYTNIGGIEKSNLNSANISLSFVQKKTGYWGISQASISFESVIGGVTVSKTELVLKTTDISTPFGFSYHCTPKMKLAADADTTVIFETNGFQLEPFKGANADRFGDWYDCQGFFTEAIWAGIFLGLIIAAVLAWAISMLADVKSPDRFDDPKGKSISVGTAE